MNCYKFNEGTFTKIQNVLEGQKAEEGVKEPTYYKSFYSPATLINEWYEKRAEHVQEKPSEPPLSEHMDKFRKPCLSVFPDRKDCFNKTFESYGLGQELLLDHLGLSFYDNYASSYDLCYNHLKKGICGPIPRHYHKGHYTPDKDLTLIYGNLTQWGLKEKVYSTMKHGKCREAAPVSESFGEFVPHDFNLVKKLNDFPTFKRVKAIY